jgi:hypothetical protein
MIEDEKPSLPRGELYVGLGSVVLAVLIALKGGVRVNWIGLASDLAIGLALASEVAMMERIRRPAEEQAPFTTKNRFEIIRIVLLSLGAAGIWVVLYYIKHMREPVTSSMFSAF